MKVEQLMSHPPQTLPPEASCQEAARLMAEASVGSVVVTGEDGRAQGIVTDRDLAVRVMARGRDPKSVTVREVMSLAPIFVLAGRDASYVLELMRDQGVRRLPVVDEDQRVIGVISLDDLIQAVAADLHAIAETIEKEL
jgi:CBS domain-containing protein